LLLHLGADRVVPRRHVLAILDVRSLKSADTDNFFQRADAQDAVETVPEGPPRSLVIAVNDAGTRRIYLSPISPLTLARRDPY
jgi:hypothetical protein